MTWADQDIIHCDSSFQYPLSRLNPVLPCSFRDGMQRPTCYKGMFKAQHDHKRRNWVLLLSLADALPLLEKVIPPYPSIDDLACLLHKCSKEGNCVQARCLHAHILKSGMDTHRLLGNHLVPMLAEVGCMDDAQQAFNRLPSPDKFSLNFLLTGFIKRGKPELALSLYDTMLRDNSLCPSSRTFGALIKACTKLKNMEKGLQIHAEVARLGLLEIDLFVCSALVDMYAKCGLLAKAQQVFDRLQVRDVVCWTALMIGLIEHGYGKEALDSLQRMQLESISPDAVSFLCGLKACSTVQAANTGRGLHAEIESLGLLDSDPLVGTTLVDMYAKCGGLSQSQEVFDKLFHRDCVSWNILIAGYVEHEHDEKAIMSFEHMQLEGVFPDAVTFVCTLCACRNIAAIELGGKIHAEIERKGLQTDVSVGNSLVDFYAKCGLFHLAKQLFDRLPYRDVVSWTSLIGGYADHGHGEGALECLEQMRAMGVPPNAATYICSLKACGITRLREEAQHMHHEVERKGLLANDLVVGNAVVDMYSKCGMLDLARQVFDKLPIQDVVSWTALIAGYVEHGRCEEALECFQRMQLDDVSPNALTYVCILKACGMLGSIGKGREIHAELNRKRAMQNNHFIGNMLVDMYAKCGSLDLAHQAFDSLCVKDVISWTTLITGYVEDGHGEAAVNCFEQMQLEGVSPNAATFVCSLKAYGSIGAIDKVEEMHAHVEIEGLLKLEPVIGNTLVDVYAKCGGLVKARAVFDKLHNPDVVSWTTLIGGYGKHGKSGEALDCLFQMQLDGISPTVTFLSSLKAWCDPKFTDICRHNILGEVETKDCFKETFLLAKCMHSRVLLP